MRKPTSVDALNDLGRVRLSESFFMREMLYSEIANFHGLPNIPDDPDLAIEAGTHLCGELLEPLQTRYGRVAIRSAYRGRELNAFGNRMQAEGKAGYNCASNEANAGGHIWDLKDADGCIGATACIVLPEYWDAHGETEGGWRDLALWIDENLPYSTLLFYPKLWAFNINWHERPQRRIDSYVTPKGRLV